MNILRLEYELKCRNISIEDYCKQLGINRATYYRKRKGKTEFTHQEIKKTVDLLGYGTTMEIFFAEKVS